MYSQAMDVSASASVVNPMHAVQQMLSIQSENLCIAYTKMAEYADQRPAASISAQQPLSAPSSLYESIVQQNALDKNA